MKPRRRLVTVETPDFNPWAVGQPGVILDGDTLAKYGDGGQIPSWDDLSGRNAGPVQAAASSRPLAKVINGNWCAYFDGVDDSLTAAAYWVNNEAWTIFGVLQTTGDNIWLADSGGFNCQIRIGQSGNVLSMYDGANNPISNSMPIARTDRTLVEYSQQATGNLALFWQNGYNVSNGVATINAGLVLNRIGTASGSGAAFTNGYIWYVVAYPFRLNDAQRKYVEGGLCKRYRIPALWS